MTAAQIYLSRIRNPAKLAYARRYYDYLRDKEMGPSPDRGNLSYLAAQAVRMAMAECWSLELRLRDLR